MSVVCEFFVRQNTGLFRVRQNNLMYSRRIYTLAYFGLIDERINWPDQDTPLIESNNPMKKNTLACALPMYRY